MLTTYTFMDSPLGSVLLTSRNRKLSGIYFADQPHAQIHPAWIRQDDKAIFDQTKRQFEECASWQRESFDLPLDLEGTAFQVQVWEAISTIPFGQTITYTELAEKIGRSAQDARAIGMATGQNPVSWVIPCHRVVGKSGELTGYAGGLERKRALLAFEAAKSGKISPSHQPELALV